jgi:hypothetical protein
VRRADGRSLGALFRDEVARPWDLDVHIGLTSADERRVGPLADPDRLWPAALLDGRDRCSTAATSAIAWRSTIRRRSRI